MTKPTTEDGPYYEFLASQGIEANPDTVAHLKVMVHAIKVYDQRRTVYGEIWKQYGALSNLLNAARKADRLMAEWWFTDGAPPPMHKDALDDAVDLLNYTVFFMRNAILLNVLGSRSHLPQSRCSRCGKMFPDDHAHPGYPEPHECHGG